ncbi:histidine kinase [Terrabacter sp. GCM10028922]|uniref:sensor histidine kinase n=1 Tax=Terrabacter sp. GCM10028922 TaxID=3273428 RepID=UPI003616F81D
MTDTPVMNERTRWAGTAGFVARAVLLAAVLLPASWSALSDSGIDAWWLWTLRAALVVLHAAPFPPLVTRAPLAAFAVGSAAMLALVTGPDLGGPMAAQAGDAFAPVLLPSSLVWFVLLYVVASRTRSPWPSAALAVGAVGGALTVMRLWDATDYAVPLSGEWGWRLFVGAAVLGGTLAAWALGRYRAARLAWADALAQRAAAHERRRIAREMHDVVAHSLAVVVAQAEGGRLAVAAQPQRAPEILDTIAVTGREALDQMRGLLGVLREEEDCGSGPDVDDLPTAPQPGLADLPALVERVRSAGTPVDLETRGTPRRLAPATELAAYRMVQESLTNVVKHAGPGSSARVELDWSDGLVVDVSDDGSGAASGGSGSSSPTTGRGLRGMRDRLQSVGGELAVGARPGGGWHNRARIPT